jgi:hypothetical protein
MLAEFDMDSLLLFPTLQTLVKLPQRLMGYGGVPRRLIEVLGICYPQSVVPEKNGV